MQWLVAVSGGAVARINDQVAKVSGGALIFGGAGRGRYRAAGLAQMCLIRAINTAGGVVLTT